MSQKMVRASRRVALAATGLLFLVASGCSSSSAPKGRENTASPSQASTSPAGSSGLPRPTLGCYADRTLNAPAPFHLSWKLDDSSGHSDWEADVTASTIDGTWTNSTGTRKIHGVRSDISSWQGAFAAFPFGSETGHFRLLANNSAMTAKGQETVNGYSAMKYAVDTTHVSAADAAVFKMTLGANGYITGTAWADKTGCVVKFIIDEAWQQSDGTLSKKHLDVGMTLK